MGTKVQATQQPAKQIGQTSDPTPQPDADNMIGFLPRQQGSIHPTQPVDGNLIGTILSQWGDDVDDD